MPEPDLAPAPPHDSQLRMVFIGAQGLRAGWRLLVFLVLVAVLSGVAFMLQKLSCIVSARTFQHERNHG